MTGPRRTVPGATVALVSLFAASACTGLGGLMTIRIGWIQWRGDATNLPESKTLPAGS